MKRMKKSTAVTLGLLIALVAGMSCVFAAEFTKFSSKFIKNFKDCDAYEESIVSEYEGKQFTTNRKIIGWRNSFCKYQETIKSPDDEYQLNCSFSNIQVDELYESMKDRAKEPQKYDLDIFSEQTDKKGQTKYVVVGSQTIKGNKAYITWAKYQNNPYFCKPQKIK